MPEHPTVGPKPSSTHVQRSTTDGTPFQSATPPPARGASNRLKGEYGETVSHEYFESLGYTRVSTPTHVNRPGIDAIYQKPDGSFVIVEAKFSSTGNGRLGNTKLDGPQMSDGWLTGLGDPTGGYKGSGTDRIFNAVNRDKGLADAITKALDSGGLEKVLTTIDGNGSLTAKLLS